ncbi:MAG: DUF29 domain-containing protein [Chloroflexi bacterium]|nr:DUF29 domain-containing protein [Chloroflexota bacterium]
MTGQKTQERPLAMTTALYKTDFYAWTVQQAEALRHEDSPELDRDNLIEEIKDMGRSEQREVENRLGVLLRHLLKLSALSTSNPSRGWRVTVKEQRYQIEKLLKRNPSLRPEVPSMIADAYAQAYDLATDDLAEDELVGYVLPVYCPWTPEQMLDLNWLP